MSTFIIIPVGLFLISLVVLTSCFGIYFSRKYKFIGNISSKRNTIILVSIAITITIATLMAEKLEKHCCKFQAFIPIVFSTSSEQLR